jgi:putative Mg2+ transporter-C (MgtC) family protein
VQGLTTAATIWCSAALGCMAALGFYWQLGVATLLVILVNTAFKKADVWFNNDQKKKNGSGKKEHFE